MKNHLIFLVLNGEKKNKTHLIHHGQKSGRPEQIQSQVFVGVVGIKQTVH